MDIITQTLFTTFLNWALTQWRVETMTVLIIILAIYFIKKYKVKLTNLEIGLSFMCLLLFYSNLFYLSVYNRQQEILKEYEETIDHYDSKIDLIYNDLELTRIITEAKAKNYTQQELIEKLEKHFKIK